MDFTILIIHSPRRFAGELRDIVRQFNDQREGLEVSLKAARNEADCLREQLRQAHRMSDTRYFAILESNLHEGCKNIKIKIPNLDL